MWLNHAEKVGILHTNEPPDSILIISLAAEETDPFLHLFSFRSRVVRLEELSSQDSLFLLAIMKVFSTRSRQPRDAFYFLFHLTCVSLATATGTCSPWKWTNDAAQTAAPSAPAAPAKPAVTFVPSGPHVANMSGRKAAGELVCRYPANTYADVDHNTCIQLANYYHITIEKFFMLNPGLDFDCGNIKPYTMYCVGGYIEPLRAYDGKCGPPNKNATCIGTSGQCCNSETWTCGKSEADCAPGTCYEGSCLGDKVYSTDGTCGVQHGRRRCAGKWGDCCNLDGKCGSGTDFCGWMKCQSGNCIIPRSASWRPSRPLLSGNTTDGTCGGKDDYVCNEVFGLCCNKSGRCGGGPSDCGVGCQSRYGQCSPASPTTTTAPTATTSLGNYFQAMNAGTCANIAANTGVYTRNYGAGSSTCLAVSLQPSCSGGDRGDPIVIYKSGKPISSFANCKDACLYTIGCTNLYFAEGRHCGLHGDAETHKPSSRSQSYYLYDASCLERALRSCRLDSQGLTVSQSSEAVCKVRVYSNGGTTTVPYSSGEAIESLKASGA